MTPEDARRFALSLPGVSEQPHFDKWSFRVRGKIFATAPPGDTHLHVFVDEQETRAAVAEEPSAFEELRWGKRLVGVRVHLPTAPPDLVYELVKEAWRSKAPKKLVTDFEAERS